MFLQIIMIELLLVILFSRASKYAILLEVEQVQEWVHFWYRKSEKNIQIEL